MTFQAMAQAPATPDATDMVSVRVPLLRERDALGRNAGYAFELGGAANARAIVRADTALLSRVLLRPDDVRAATLQMNIYKREGDFTGAKLRFYRMLRTSQDSTPLVAGRDYEAKPAVEVSLADVPEEGAFAVTGLAPALQGPMEHGLLVEMVSVQQPKPRLLIISGGADAPEKAVLEISARRHPSALLFDHDLKPRAGVYTTFRDGHLFYGGRRLRLWGMVGDDKPARLRQMGFNAQRVWNPTSQEGGGSSELSERQFYTFESAKKGLPAPHTKGDGSEVDNADKYFASLKENGMFVMFAALSGIMPVEPALEDDSFIAGGADWAAWRDAMKAAKNKVYVARYAIYFDERLQKLKLQHATNLLNHVNLYTGKKYGEDEAIAVYEMWNEQGFLKRALESDLDLPPYFNDKAQAQWNEWLRARYKDDAGLRAAWGALKDGESLAAGTVKRTPIVKDRADYPPQRAGDHVRFLTEKVEAFQREFVAHCRKQAAQGAGVNVAPFSFDTQYQPSIHWPLSKSVSQVNSFGMYYWDLTSQLTRPPAMYVIDANRVEGRASVLYETNSSRPGPYRAEYPLRLATLAAWQDFDGVFFHYWQTGGYKSPEELLMRAMPHAANDFPWTAAHHEVDPVMSATMAAASRIFLSGAIAPAPDPVTYRVGKEGIYSLDLVNGVDARKNTFARGSQLRFEPEGDFKVREESKTSVPAAPEGAVRAGEQIVWDYANGRLIVDTPTAKIYVGQTSPDGYTFKDGIALSGFSSPFISWAMVSGDGKPLAQTSRALVTGQFNAENTGFDMDWNVAGGPDRQSRAIKNRGRAPVLVDRVDYTVSFPHKLDYTFAGYDFAVRRALEQKATGTNVLRVRDHEVWMGVLEIARRGAAAAPVLEAGTPRPTLVARHGQGTPTVTDARLANAFNPLPNLSWGDSYARAHQILRDGAFVKTSVSRENPAPAANETILLTEAEIENAGWFNLPADVEVRFAGGRMSSIAGTFKRPPIFTDAASALEKRFGAPVEKSITGDQTKNDVVRWIVKNPAADLEVALSTSQGVVTLVYTLKPRA